MPVAVSNNANQAPARRTNVDLQAQQTQFDTLATRIANMSRRHAHGGYTQELVEHNFTHMPQNVADIVNEAANAGFLYDADGNQIWDFRADSLPTNEYNTWYLHYGNTTYRIYEDPQYNLAWDVLAENHRLVPAGSLNQLLAHPRFNGRFNVPLPAFQRVAPQEPASAEALLADFDAREKPQLSSFWEFVDNLLMAITGGRSGIPSMNDYRQRRQAFATETQQSTALAMETYQARLTASENLDANDQRLSEVRSARERRHARGDRLHQTMLDLSGPESSLSITDRQTVFSMAAYLQEKINSFDNNSIRDAEFDNVCNLFADYFGRNAAPESRNTLLNELRGLHYADIERYFDNTLAQIQQPGMQQPGMQQPGAQQLNGPGQQEVPQEPADPNIIQVPHMPV